MSQMMDPGMMGPPPDADPGMGGGAPGPSPDMGGMGLPPDIGGGNPAGPEGAGGGLPPELLAALGGGAPGGDMNSQDMLAEGPMAGEDTASADEDAGEDDPLTLVRDAISLLRRAGDVEPDDVRSHSIDKIQADLQKLLAGESQKTDKLRQALGG